MFFHYRLKNKNEGDLRREMWIWSNCSVWPKHHGWVPVQRHRLWSGGDIMPMPSKDTERNCLYSQQNINQALFWHPGGHRSGFVQLQASSLFVFKSRCSCTEQEQGKRSYNNTSIFDARLKSYGPKSWKHLSGCSYDEQHPQYSYKVFIMHVCTWNVYWLMF